MTQTILLADDSVTIQKVIELTFMDEDYEVISAGDGDEALDRLEEVAPDVVIADVHMPGASGFDVAKRSKQLHPATPVLLLVGTFEPFEEQDFESSGADSFLKKPFDSQELLQRVTDLLEAAPEASDDAEEAPLGTATEPLSMGDTPPPPPASTPAAADEDDLSDLGTRAIPELGGGQDEAVQPAVPPEPAPEVSADAGDAGEAGDLLDQTDDEPFPELSTPAAPGPAPSADDDDIFRGFAEADGSTEVRPPIGGEEGEDEDEEVEVEPPAFELEDEVGFQPQPDVGRTGPESEVRAEPAPESEEPAPSGVPAPAAATAEAGRNDGAAAASTGAAGGALSDADVDRIARRVVELLGGDALRDVAWDVVPDLAEVVIRERLRELEEQAEPS